MQTVCLQRSLKLRNAFRALKDLQLPCVPSFQELKYRRECFDIWEECGFFTLSISWQVCVRMILYPVNQNRYCSHGTHGRTMQGLLILISIGTN